MLVKGDLRMFRRREFELTDCGFIPPYCAPKGFASDILLESVVNRRCRFPRASLEDDIVEK